MAVLPGSGRVTSESSLLQRSLAAKSQAIARLTFVIESEELVRILCHAERASVNAESEFQLAVQTDWASLAVEDRTRDIARLWTLAQPAVSAFVSSIVRNFRDRDDVLQEVAVAVIDSFESYDPSRPFVAWAIGIARNHVRNYLRGQERDRHVFSLESEAMDSVAQAFVEVAPTVSSRSAFLAECIDTLGNRAKKLCGLRYAEGQQPTAIGQSLDMTPNSVAKALQRIREQLRDCIERKRTAQEA